MVVQSVGSGPKSTRPNRSTLRGALPAGGPVHKPLAPTPAPGSSAEHLPAWTPSRSCRSTVASSSRFSACPCWASIALSCWAMAHARLQTCPSFAQGLLGRGCLVGQAAQIDRSIEVGGDLLGRFAGHQRRRNFVVQLMPLLVDLPRVGHVRRPAVQVFFVLGGRRGDQVAHPLAGRGHLAQQFAPHAADFRQVAARIDPDWSAAAARPPSGGAFPATAATAPIRRFPAGRRPPGRKSDRPTDRAAGGARPVGAAARRVAAARRPAAGRVRGRPAIAWGSSPAESLPGGAIAASARADFWNSALADLCSSRPARSDWPCD